MDALDVFACIDKLIPKDLALVSDKIGYFGKKNPKNLKFNKIKVLMDFYPEDDKLTADDELIVSHHPPIFNPESPVYVVHSNWDIIDGGANDALAEFLNFKVIDVFDDKTGIGRICSCNMTFDNLIKVIGEKFNSFNLDVIDTIRIVNRIDYINKVAIVSGFGLSNLDYINLAKEKGVDLFISGDLTLKGISLAKKLDISLIDLSHYSSEFPGLKSLVELLKTIPISVYLANKDLPWEDISLK